jgi:ABC-2 type transport system ATP-binding protein
VHAFGRRHEVLHAESLAGHTRALVRLSGPDDGDAVAGSGLAVENTSIQQLVVALSRQEPSGRTPPLRAAEPADFEEVS